MLYNLKITTYGDEVQLSHYSTFIARKDEVLKNEVSKRYIDVNQSGDTVCKQLSPADVKIYIDSCLSRSTIGEKEESSSGQRKPLNKDWKLPHKT